VVVTLVKVNCTQESGNYIVTHNEHVMNIVQHVLIPFESCAFDAREPSAQNITIIMTSLLRDVCFFYYTPVGDHKGTKRGEWLCKKCGKTRLMSGGWTNLLNHLGSCVGLN
jgi:hypothetical protein